MALKKKLKTRLDLIQEELDNKIYVKEVDGKKVSDSRNMNFPSNHIKNYLDKSSEIAPVKKITTANKTTTNNNTWFSKGAFSDGYQVGDLTKTILGTTGDATTGVVKGLFNLGEGIGDTINYGAAAVGDLFGADEWADEYRKEVSKSVTDQIFKPVEDFFDKNSILGEKSDNISQGLGNVAGIVATGGLGSSMGLGTLGTSVLTTGTVGMSSTGSGMSEAYQGGATDEEALKYGIISGVAEAGTELIFGGLGKTVNALGLSKGLSSADDMVAKAISNKFKSQLAKNLTQYTVKAGAEGLEEVMSGLIQGIGKKVTYMSEEELGKILADEKLLDQFIMGAVTSGIAQTPSLIKSNVAGRDYVSGYTQNEQKVIDKEIENRIGDKKLTNKEISEITEEVKADFNKGYISTETIESVLGGEEYNAYKSILDKQNRYNELLDKKSGETSNRERIELEALKDELDGVDINTLKSNLDSSMANKITKDDYLQRSYQERVKKGQLYEQTETSDNEKINNWQQSFVDAKSNNTSKAHDFSEFGNKIIQDKNISMRAVNYDTLVEEGKMRKREVDNTTIYEMNVNGKWKEVAVNGYKENGVLNINLQSNRAFETTVGHELGEFIKDSDSTMYEELKNIAVELGKADRTYNEAALNKYADLYGENTDNVVDEYVNDKLGELFTNEKFVEQLSTKPNIIKKIINEIKHLVKMATAGSNEQRKLLSLQHKLENKFKEAYEKTDLTKESATQTESNTKYSIQQKEDGSKYVNVDTDQDIFSGIAKKDYNKIAKMYINDYLKGDTLLSNSDIAIIDSKSANKYTNPGKKQPNFVEKMKLTPELKNVLAISEKIDVSLPTKDNSKYSNWEYYQFDFKINDKTFSGLVNIGIDKNGNKHFYEVNNIHNLDTQKRTSGISETSPNRPTSSSSNNISQNKTDVKFSLTDNQGRTLTKEQQEYFKDSKVRDENGNLLTYYNGSGNFTVYDKNKMSDMSKWGKGIYLTKYEDIAHAYGENVKELYVNITNPISQTQKTISFKQYNDLYKSINDGENSYREEYDMYDNDLDLLWDMTNHGSWADFSEQIKEYTGKDGLIINDDVKSEDMAIAFSSNQIKNIDNTNPTSDADIRYSLSEDTQGRKLSDNQKEYFKDVSNELKDENGNLKVLYHGSNSEFTIFDLNKGGASNSKAGVGFWFTESGIGAKNFAESVWYGDRTPTTYEVYLNLKNPKVYEPVDTKAQKQELNKKLKELYNKKRNIEDEYAWETPSLTIVAEYLKDYKESDVANNLIKNCGYREAQAKKYIEAAEEYNKLVKEYKSIEKEHDNLGYDDSYEQFRTDIYKVAGMSANDANTGGVGMAINNNDEVIKQYRDNLIKEGYDGIVIKNTVYDTQTLGEGNNQYVAFYPEQIKNVTNENPTDNPDINLSLSQQGEQIAPTGDYNVYGEDVKLQIAPLKEEIKTLTETVQELKEQIAPVKSEQLDTAMNSRALTEEDLPMLERQYNEAPMNDIAPPEIEQTIDYMPDAISMDNKTLKTLTRNIKNELGLNRIQTTELEKVVQEFTTNETATREDLFNAISERFSEQTLEHKNEEIIAIKNFLRNYPIKVSNYLKTEFKEGFNKVRQSNFNKLKFTNDGTEVDAAYQELSSMFPSLFLDDIANAQDQLSKIIEVANLDVMSTEEFVLPEEMVRETSDFIYDSIQDYKLDEVFKAAEQVRRLPIDENMIPVEIAGNSVENKDIAPVKAQATESVEENKNLTIKESNALKLKNLESTMEKYRVDAENSFNSFKELIREKNSEYDALANKNTLKANNLLQQVRRLVAQRDNIQVEYERKMNNIQKRIDRMNSKEFKTAEQRMSKQEEYREQARALIGDTSFWKDKKLGIQYQINTFKRNLRDIVKGADGKADIQTADAIYEEYQGNYNRNEAKLKVESNKIKQPYMDMKLTKQEDAYVQMLGELKYNPDTTLRQDVVEGYYELNKKHIDISKVNKAIEMARKTYDSLYERINEVLRNQGMKELGYRQGYFPHFTEEKQSMLAKLFDWKVKNNEIPTDIAGLTELNNPERSWQSFNKQRRGDTTDYSFSKGLDTYVHGALDWIYHIEDIQKRRALENEIRYQHSEKGVQEKIEAIYNNPELDADEVQTQIEAIYGVAKNPLNNFVTDLRNSTNNLTGKKSSADRGLEYATNRQIYSIMTNISSRVSGNMVGGSISSALTNFIPITQSWGEVSPLSSLNAIRETIKSSIKDDGTIVKSTFLTNRLVKEEKLSKTNWDKASDVVGVMTEVIDNITSQTVWRSKYNENIKKGMSEFNAIKNADQFAENVIAGRSRGNQPTIFNSKNPITKMLTAFQLEVANQYGYMLKDMPTDISEKSKGKLIKGYASMFMGAYLYNALYSSLTGRDSAFDPIGIVEDILKEFGFGDDDEEEKSASEKLTSITEDLVQEIPFIGGLFGGGRLPISSAIPYENPFEMATGTMTDVLDAFDEEKKEKALKDLTSEWLKPVTYLALPFGGGQISKSIKGLSMYDEDLPIAGSYTNGGDLRFTADESLGGKLKSFLFGQYASKSAQEYVDSGFKTIKKSNIEELMDLGMTSTEYRKYRQELKNAGNTNKSKLDYINGLDAPISHKNIMANNVLDRDYKVDMRDYTTYDEFDFSYKNPEKYEWLQKNNISYSDYIANDESKEAYNWAYSNPESYLVSRTVTDDVVAYRQYKSEIGNLKADYNSNGKQIKDSRRNKVIDYVNSLNLSVPQRAILIRQEYLTFNDYNNEIVEYVRNLNISYDEKVSILEELDMTIKDGRVYWK